MGKYILAPSILSADFLHLGEEIKKVEEAGAQYLHFDVMDGLFVPSISFGMPVLRSVRTATDRCLDVHLMIERPERYVENFAKCGADIITIHVEACDCVEDTLRQIRGYGCRAGITLNPGTAVEAVYPYLSLVDMVLVMTVQPGFGGQKYINDCTGKIKALYGEIQSRGMAVDIEVDGGINRGTLNTVLEAGANVIVAGSAVFGDDTAANAEYFRKELQKREKEKNT